MGTPENDPLGAAIGDEISYWRRKRKLTREQLATAAGLSATTIGRYERGDSTPDVSETWRIAEALDIALHVLVQRAEEAVRISADASLLAAARKLQPEGRRSRAAQDADAEAPDPAGPEEGV